MEVLSLCSLSLSFSCASCVVVHSLSRMRHCTFDTTKRKVTLKEPTHVVVGALCFDTAVVAYAARFRTPNRANDESARITALVQKSQQ